MEEILIMLLFICVSLTLFLLGGFVGTFVRKKVGVAVVTISYVILLILTLISSRMFEYDIRLYACSLEFAFVIGFGVIWNKKGH